MTASVRMTLVLCMLLACIMPATGQSGLRVVTDLYQWGPAVGGLVEGTPGVFYTIGGREPYAVFSVNTEGTKIYLALLPKGLHPQAPLVSGANQLFYSAFARARSHHQAQVFSVGHEPGKQDYDPQDIDPLLTQNLPDGSLLAIGAGPFHSPWYIAKVNLDGSVIPLSGFPNVNGVDALLFGNDGNYYGVAVTNTSGYIFRRNPGSDSTLYSFPAGSFALNQMPVPFIQAHDGTLYGATPYGANGSGTLYKVTLDGQYTLLYTFPANDNAGALIEASDGNIYGSSRTGDLFRITPSGQYSVLYTASNASCVCALIPGSDGILYGAFAAGPYPQSGIIYAFDAGLRKPVPRAHYLAPPQGSVGTEVRIWGDNLLSASVTFNGVAADSVYNSGPNYIYATVPAGATTGPLTITTPGGSVTTASFFVH